MKKIFSLVAALLMLGVVLSLDYSDDNSAVEINEDVCCEDDNRVVDSLLNTMTLREKVSQLIIVAISSGNSPKNKKLQERLVSEYGIGGLIVMDDDLTLSMARVNELQSKSKFPLLVTIDGEWGVSMRYDEYPKYPYQMQLGALTDDSLIYKMGKCVAAEAKDLNIYVNFAPTVDINNNPNNPVINTRSFGEDKEKVAKFGAAYMRGMQDGGIYTSAKHFPGHGDTNVDSHHGMPILTFDKERLEDVELYPFRELIAQGADMVMVGHLSIPSLDSTGTPASISKPIVTGLLKEQMGYDGIVITDALGMKGVSELMSPPEVTLEAYKAGVDILLMPEDVPQSISEVVRYVKKDKKREAELDAKVKKMLSLKVKAGMFNQGYTPIIDTLGLDNMAQKKDHLALIEEISKRSMTMVVNHNGTIPISLKKGFRRLKKIGYLGYKADSVSRVFGNTLRQYADVDTFYLDYTVDYTSQPEYVNKLDSVRKILDGYDEVIVGFHKVDTRPHYNFGIDTLCSDYFDKWSGEKGLIGVYFGSPYALDKLPWHSRFKAFVVGYHHNIFNNSAAAQLLFGGIPAQGVLPVGTSLYPVGTSMKTCPKEWKGKRKEIFITFDLENN